MMDNCVILQWKSFPVDLTKMRIHLKALLSSNFDGLIANNEALMVQFFEDVLEADQAALAAYWAAASTATYAVTAQEIVGAMIANAITFGNKLIVDASTENILLGITVAGKTRVVSDYCEKLQTYLRTGSLYAAVEALDVMIADEDRDALDMEPFVTTERLESYKAKIMDYLT